MIHRNELAYGFLFEDPKPVNAESLSPSHALIRDRGKLWIQKHPSPLRQQLFELYKQLDFAQTAMGQIGWTLTNEPPPSTGEDDDEKLLLEYLEIAQELLGVRDQIEQWLLGNPMQNGPIEAQIKTLETLKAFDRFCGRHREWVEKVIDRML